MCGFAEAALAMSVVSAVTGTMAARDEAQQTVAAQRRMDAVAYRNYQINTQILNKQADQIRTQSAQESMSQAIKSKQVEGQIRVAQGEKGLGDFAVDDDGEALMDLLFQTATGRARLEDETNAALDQNFLEQEAAYLNYRARNASFRPTPVPGFGDALLEIGQAAANYGQNPNRQFFTNTGGRGTGSLYNYGYSGPASVGDYI